MIIHFFHLSIIFPICHNTCHSFLHTIICSTCKCSISPAYIIFSKPKQKLKLARSYLKWNKKKEFLLWIAIALLVNYKNMKIEINALHSKRRRNTINIDKKFKIFVQRKPNWIYKHYFFSPGCLLLSLLSFFFFFFFALSLVLSLYFKNKLVLIKDKFKTHFIQIHGN